MSISLLIYTSALSPVSINVGGDDSTYSNFATSALFAVFSMGEFGRIVSYSNLKASLPQLILS